jgi:fucose 4-O-acetylase-like acetyltransferase
MPGSLTAAAKPVSRDVTIDVARGIAIVLVVLGHNSALAGAAPAFIDTLFLFHVPLFFLLSGLVQPSRSIKATVTTLARRLLLPFLVAAFAVGALKLMFRGGSAEHLLAGIAWGTGQTLPWSHLWFLPALFLALLAAQALRKMPGGPARWAGACLAALIVVLTVPMAVGPDFTAMGFAAPVGLPWSIDLLPACLLFVCLGALLQDAPAVRARLEQPVVAAVAVLLFALALGARTDLNLRELDPPALALLAAASGCVVTLALARALAAVRPIAHLFTTFGRHTLVIFLLHVSIQKALLGLLSVQTSTIARVFSGLATAAVAILVGLAVSAAWERLLSQRRARRMSLPAREVVT